MRLSGDRDRPRRGWRRNGDLRFVGHRRGSWRRRTRQLRPCDCWTRQGNSAVQSEVLQSGCQTWWQCPVRARACGLWRPAGSRLRGPLWRQPAVAEKFRAGEEMTAQRGLSGVCRLFRSCLVRGIQNLIKRSRTGYFKLALVVDVAFHALCSSAGAGVAVLQL